eukprot:gene16695-22144_t
MCGMRTAWLLGGLATVLLGAGLPMSPAIAARSAAVATERVTATLISETDTITPGQPFRLGLHLRMAPG